MRFAEEAAQSHVRLHLGQTWRFHAFPGERLRIVAGAIRLSEPPLWLAEQVFIPGRAMSAGETYLCGARGWYLIEACRDSIIEPGTPVPSYGLVRGALAGWWRRLTASWAALVGARREPGR
jgi:hypothetical protein